MFDTDPIAERRKGWAPRPDGTVKLVRAWQPPEVGAGVGGPGDEFLESRPWSWGVGPPPRLPSQGVDPFHPFGSYEESASIPEESEIQRYLDKNQTFLAPQQPVFTPQPVPAPQPRADADEPLLWWVPPGDQPPEESPPPLDYDDYIPKSDDSKPYRPSRMSPYAPPPRRLSVGYGQDEELPGVQPTPTPPARDDWYKPTNLGAQVAVAEPPQPEYPSLTEPSTPLPAPFKPAVASPRPDAPGVVGAPTPRVPASRPAGGAVGAPAPPRGDGGYSPFDNVFRAHAGDLADNDEFISIVAAGTLAESGWDSANTTGDGGHSWGLFQMHDAGAGAGWGHARLDPHVASSVMVPRYAEGYRIFKKQGFSGPELAARVAQYAERSADPTGRAYADAYNRVMGGGAGTHKMREAPSPPASESVNPAEVWGSLGPRDDELNPASVWQSLQGRAEVNPADVWGKVGVGQDEEEDPEWASRLYDPSTEVPIGSLPTTTPRPMVPSDRSERISAGTSSSSLFDPQRDVPETPQLPPQEEPRIIPEYGEEPERRLEEAVHKTVVPPVVDRGFSAETQPLALPKPDVGRPIQAYTPPEGQPVLPSPEDPNKDLTAIGKQVAGAPVNPFELHDDIQQRFEQAVIPENIRDAPAVGGLVEMALDPAWMTGGPEAAATNLGTQVAGNAIKALGGNVIAKAPAFVRLADASMGYATKAGADALLRGLERIQPGLGREVASRLPAYAAREFAASIGAGATAGGVTAAITPEDDPNRYAKIVGAAGAGALGAFGVIHVTPAAIHELNKIFSPAHNLPPHVQALVAQLAHAQEGGRVDGDMWEQRILDVLADRPKDWKPWEWGFPKRGTGLDHWTSADSFEKTRGFAPTMTPAQQALADDMWHFGEMTRKEGKRLGFIRGDVTLRPGVEAYFPHMWEDEWRKQVTSATKRGLNPHDFFTDFRTHDTLADGFSTGLKPVDSLSEAWGAYVRRYNSSKAKRQFALGLRKTGGPDVIRRTSGKRPAAPEGWVSGAEFSIPGFNQFHVSPDMATVLHNIEDPSKMRNAPILGGAMNLLAEAKRALFAPSAFHLVHELHQVINAQGKEGVPVFAKSLYYNMNPWAFRKFALVNAPELVRAANAGVTMMRQHPEAPDIGAFGIQNPLGAAATRAAWSGATTGMGAYGISKANLEDDRTALESGLKYGAAGAALGVAGGPISRGLWERAVPTMKLLTWQTMAARYGEKPAAEFVNEVYGGQNLEAIGRSKTLQDVLRLVALAPDWQEGWARQIGNGIRGIAAVPYAAAHGGKTNSPLGTANAWYWTNAAITGAFMLEGLNYGFNGHFTNENSDGHQLALELTGLYDKMGWPHKDEKGRPYRVYQDILGPYRGLIEAPFDPGKFVKARMGLGPSAIGEIVSGKDFTGKDIVAPGEDPLKNAGLRFMHAASRLAPVSGASIVQTFGKEPPAVAATSAVTGWRTSRVSPIAEQLRARDKALEDIGLSPERIQRANETYTNLLAIADRQFTATLNRKNLTHQQIDAELAKIKHPDRADIMTANLPTNLAGDPSKAVELRDTLRKYAGFGTASTQYPADIQPESMIDVDAIAARYWTPKPGIETLPKQQQDSIRQKELAQMANEYDVEINTLMDAIKAQTRGQPIKPVPGVSAGAIDDWVKRWASKTSDDPMEQSAQRRQEINTIASEYHLDPDTVWQRIKLRYLPPDKPGELEQSRDKALDMLFSAHDPQRFPKYVGLNGEPMGGPDQWKDFDAQIAGAKTAREKSKPEIKALIEARDKATATQRKYIMNNPSYSEYQRWFGIGRGMNEAQWAKYQKGDYPHYKDTSDPGETLNRDRIADQWKASTPAERRTQMVDITIEGKRETLSLEAARRHLQFELKAGWTKALGLDTTGAGELSSEGT